MATEEMEEVHNEDGAEYTEEYDHDQEPASKVPSSLDEAIASLANPTATSQAGYSRREGHDGAQPSTSADLEGYDPEAQAESDKRSIYVGNVEYTVLSAELAELFSSCGTVNKVTIPGDAQNHPKGYAYIEFAEQEAVEHATKLTGTQVKGRAINVAPKRTNIQGFSRGRGRGSRGRGRVPFGYHPYVVPMPVPFFPFPGRGRGGRGGRARGRGRQAYAPY